MNKKILLAVVALQIFFMNFAFAENIIDKPLPLTENRLRLTREYAQTHYGTYTNEIIPQAVVIHWTAGSTWESAYYTFYNDDRGDGSVNVSSQFIVDRDGTIYRLMPENFMARHVIGYNHCAVGIENVGGVGSVEDLTDAQLSANIFLIRYLREKFPTIKYVFGHYQQVAARESGLYIENVQGYYSIKPDPGAKFMAGLRAVLEQEGLKFFQP